MDVKKHTNKIKAYIKISYQSEKFYQINYFVNLFECIMYIIASYYLWIAIYGGKNLIKEMTIKNMISYIIIARIIDKIYEADIGEVIGNKLITGDISLYLTKPINPLLAMLMESVGKMFFQLLKICIPLYIISSIFFSFKIPGFKFVIFFIIQLLIGYILFLIISVFIGSIGMYTQNINGLNALKNILVAFFSGSFIPLNLFPDVLKKIADFLPFKGMYYEPINTFLGRNDFNEILKLILVEFSWCIVFVLLTILLWEKGKKYLIVRGG